MLLNCCTGGGRHAERVPRAGDEPPAHLLPAAGGRRAGGAGAHRRQQHDVRVEGQGLVLGRHRRRADRAPQVGRSLLGLGPGRAQGAWRSTFDRAGHLSLFSEALAAPAAAAGGRVWSYESPTPEFEAIKGHLSFYAEPFECSVDGERVQAQVGVAGWRAWIAAAAAASGWRGQGCRRGWAGSASSAREDQPAPASAARSPAAARQRTHASAAPPGAPLAGGRFLRRLDHVGR